MRHPDGSGRAVEHKPALRNRTPVALGGCTFSPQTALMATNLSDGEPAMANASKKNMGSGAQGKGDGTGAMTELPDGVLEENMVLSNRDKSLHSDERGLDSRMVQTEQYHDHAAARRNFDEGQPGAGEDGANTTGLSGPMTNTSGEESSLKSRGE